SPYLPYFLTQGRNPQRRLPWSMTRFGAGTGRWSALAWTAALILRRGLNETFPLSGDSGIRESNSARRSYFWFATQGGGRWLGVESILRKTSDESSMRNARAIPISWFGTRC